MVKPEEDAKKLKKIPESESFDRMLAEIREITSDKDEQLKLLEERVITDFVHYCACKSNKEKASSSSSSSSSSASGIKNNLNQNSATEKQPLESPIQQNQHEKLSSSEHERLQVQDSIPAAEEAKQLLSLILQKGYKIGKSTKKRVTGSRKPVLDKKKDVIRWPVLLLYPEVYEIDFIEDFCETDTFSSRLDIMLSAINLPLPWDKKNKYTAYYTREAVELYYKAVVEDASEGTSNSGATEDSDSVICTNKGTKWVKVDENSTLEDVLKQPDFVIPGIPEFYVVSNITDFYKDEFKPGLWHP